MDLASFVHTQLPPPPASVLEVGCGRGELALGIHGRGHAVTGIDPNAPEGDLFQAVSLEQFVDPGPFDAVVASRSLHHIADLPAALDKIACLLQRGGRLIVHEHAWDRVDEPTARWYLDRRAAAHAPAPGSVAECLAKWRRDHAGLHAYTTLCEELDRRFKRRYFAWAPYLYGELGGAVEQEERALIDAGTIKATGFHYVGER